jgi:hypothetical protein
MEAIKIKLLSEKFKHYNLIVNENGNIYEWKMQITEPIEVEIDYKGYISKGYIMPEINGSGPLNINLDLSSLNGQKTQLLLDADLIKINN